jgi:hypothetical protein
MQGLWSDKHKFFNEAVAQKVRQEYALMLLDTPKWEGQFGKR